jgi:hypothetical protein
VSRESCDRLEVETPDIDDFVQVETEEDDHDRVGDAIRAQTHAAPALPVHGQSTDDPQHVPVVIADMRTIALHALMSDQILDGALVNLDR